MANNDITATMGFDGSDFENALDSAVSKAATAGNKFESAKNKSKGFFDLAGDNKVKRNIAGLGRELANATSAADATGIALNRLENIFQSNLGAGIAVAAIGLFISKVIASREEWTKFDAAIRKTQTDGLGKIALGDFDGALATTKKGIEDLNTQLTNSKGIIETWARVFSGGYTQEDINVRLKNMRKNLLNMQADAWNAKKEQQAEESDWMEKKTRDEQEILRLQDTGQKRKAEDLQRQLEYETKLRAIRSAGLPFNVEQSRAATVAMEKSYADMQLEKKRRSEENQSLISEEMKSPQQRQNERLNDAATARAEDRAIDRSVNKMADKAASSMVGGKRFTTDELDALKKERKDERAKDREEAKRPAKEIKDAAENRMRGKDGVKDGGQAKDFKAVNLIVDVFKNAM